MINATQAHAIASDLMTAMGKKTFDHIGEWNELLLYLEAKKREEASK